eukprot:TRINITY_DN2960_c0_g1_i1.p1 TRINITY_DN2960_c0_g1~~TRINITY_DN2960_c0_g1_i1.p1  ORF type:complete len:334 (+),score=88.62 TRINITY_DN2960_c0_g1_i1:74-1075(+)
MNEAVEDELLAALDAALDSKPSVTASFSLSSPTAHNRTQIADSSSRNHHAFFSSSSSSCSDSSSSHQVSSKQCPSSSSCSSVSCSSSSSSRRTFSSSSFDDDDDDDDLIPSHSQTKQSQQLERQSQNTYDKPSSSSSSAPSVSVTSSLHCSSHSHLSSSSSTSSSSSSSFSSSLSFLSHQNDTNDEDLDDLLNSLDNAVSVEGPKLNSLVSASRTDSKTMKTTTTKALEKRHCYPVYLSAADEDVQRGKACNSLLCTSCDHTVLRIPHCRWSASVDYLFLRNNYPDLHKLRSCLEHSADECSYACQCTSKSVNSITNLSSQSKSRWICSGHAI